MLGPCENFRSSKPGVSKDGITLGKIFTEALEESKHHPVFSVIGRRVLGTSVTKTVPAESVYILPPITKSKSVCANGNRLISDTSSKDTIEKA